MLILRDEDYYNALQASIHTSESEFFRAIINSWKEKYPNDLVSELFEADFLYLKNKKDDALERLAGAVRRDPEFLKAYQKIERINQFQEDKENSSAIFVLSGEVTEIDTVFPWAVTLRAIRSEVRRGGAEKAKKMLKSLLEQRVDHILVAIEHCRINRLLNDYIALTYFAERYHQKWPECLQIRLFMAEGNMEVGKEAKAVEILHDCVMADPGGQVPDRLWGLDHQYKQLWPTNRYVEINVPIPSAIAIPMNWNKLVSGEEEPTRDFNSEAKPVDTDTAFIEEKIGLKSKKSPGEREPVYVVMTTRMGLERQYGPKTTKLIIDKLEELSHQVDKKPGWSSVVFIPDDLNYVLKFGLTPIKGIDPWKIKLLLSDLDTSLKEQSKMIGAVLIVGGDSIVPFHRLPNPTDDSDREVLSDNPYATTSGNFLLPEWSVGRIPGERGPDAGLVLEQLRQIITFHKTNGKQKTSLELHINSILKWFNFPQLLSEIIKKPKNFGYTAAVWRRSSLAAFRPLGKGSDLRITPPFDYQNIDIENLLRAKSAFFNLHGLADTPEWYGQRDFSEPADGPDFPVAINANQIINTRNNIDMVFTEACYGANIINKSIDDSIAMKLISIACQGFVGSTCIAYGSVFTPLIGADLLAFIFWKYLKDGYSFGESLLQAKNGLIQIMSQRQGYLDGEDQKTLISFVLYGDPLGYLEPNIYLDRKFIREEPKIYINLINDKDGFLTNNSRISENTAKNLNEILQTYMPSIGKASISIREHQVRIEKIINGRETADNNTGSPPFPTSNRTQITYKQSTRFSQHQHNQFAKATLDENGKLVKLAVSR